MSTEIILGDRPIPEFRDHIRRYCGLAWSGGPPENWAYRFYDALPEGDPSRVHDVDLVHVAVVHPALTRDDIAWFTDVSPQLTELLGRVEPSADIADRGTASREALIELANLAAGRLALATRIMHRKRPQLVPMFGRHLTDNYRGVLTSRGEAAWRNVVDAIADDLSDRDTRADLESVRRELQSELATVPSALRLADIAIWMNAR